MILKCLSVCVLATAIVGCTTTAQKTENGDSVEPVQTTSESTEEPAVDNSTATGAGQNQLATPSDISRLQSQVTALQEQLIKVNNDTSAILRMNQIMVAQAQVNTANTTAQAQPNQAQATAINGANNQGSLNTVLKKLEDISPSPQGSFGIVSSYTIQKQWVLIRFDRQTGETWLADNNGWNPLQEQEDLPISQYDIHLIRADQDKKGYVASRIDKRTGDTWWLNTKQWVVYK
jgi:hypothetical protein